MQLSQSHSASGGGVAGRKQTRRSVMRVSSGGHKCNGRSMLHQPCIISKCPLSFTPVITHWSSQHCGSQSWGAPLGRIGPLPKTGRINIENGSQVWKKREPNASMKCASQSSVHRACLRRPWSFSPLPPCFLTSLHHRRGNWPICASQQSALSVPSAPLVLSHPPCFLTSLHHHHGT